ncbi:hypothetical protein F5X97DRAFT_295958 [Nemania serpens]|nr:hypothetical protein F5X97DRAFT_295958 [Nemania serpens]
MKAGKSQNTRPCHPPQASVQPRRTVVMTVVVVMMMMVDFNWLPAGTPRWGEQWTSILRNTRYRYSVGILVCPVGRIFAGLVELVC